MLDKLVIHMKNIIFFKAVMYVIFIALLSALLPVFKEDLEKSNQRKLESQALLEAAKFKLKSMIDFEDEIIDTNEKYQDLMKNANSHSCSERIKFINNMSLLSKKYNLLDPIKVKITKRPNAKFLIKENGPIQVHCYNIYVKFRAVDRASLLAITREIYQLLPPGSSITDTQVRTLKALTPKIISKLNTERAPGLIKVKINALLKEIVYEK